MEPTGTLVPVLALEHRVLGVSREEPHRPVLSPLGLGSGSPKPNLPVRWALGFLRRHNTTPLLLAQGGVLPWDVTLTAGCRSHKIWLPDSAASSLKEPKEMGSLASKDTLTKAVSQPKHIHYAESTSPSLQQALSAFPTTPFCVSRDLASAHFQEWEEGLTQGHQSPGRKGEESFRFPSSSWGSAYPPVCATQGWGQTLPHS